MSFGSDSIGDDICYNDDNNCNDDDGNHFDDDDDDDEDGDDDDGDGNDDEAMIILDGTPQSPKCDVSLSEFQWVVLGWLAESGVMDGE